MLTETILPLISRWIHILAAVTAVGGMLFMRFVLMPAASQALTDEQHVALRERVMARWGKIVGLSIGLLLITGFYNFVHTGVPKGKEVPVITNASMGRSRGLVSTAAAAGAETEATEGEAEGERIAAAAPFDSLDDLAQATQPIRRSPRSRRTTVLISPPKL